MINIQKSASNTFTLSFLCMIMFLAILGGCSKQKTRENMDAKELSENAVELSKKKKYENAIAFLEELVRRFPDHANLASHKILLAEMYFKNKQYAASQEVFEHYNQFYPSDKQAEYSKYKSLLSMHYQTLSHDCDQSATEETIRLCDEYLNNPIYKDYRKDALDIKRTCQNKLIDKEVYVFNFYTKHENYDAAHKRLAHLKEKYLNNNPSLEARLLYLECKLAQREKKKDRLKENLNILFKKYPESQFTQMAHAMTSPLPFIAF